MNARTNFDAGNLSEALTAALAEVKQVPTDRGRRAFLCELACFVGDLERADRQLDLLGDQDPQAALGISLFRQLVRAEGARQQFYDDGRVPEFLAEPTQCLKLHLEASILAREGKNAEANEKLVQAEELRPKVKGACDGHSFNDFRDLDDLTAPFFEVLTTNGKYYWVPVERVESIEFRPPQRPRDLLWRQVRMIVRDGPDGEIYMPTLYAGTHKAADDNLRLGRATDWRGGNGVPMRGVGQRTFLLDDDAKTVLEIKELRFDGA
jgi:type VI secretion system protein ImpE